MSGPASVPTPGLTGYALVTGATAGIGAAFSRRLAAEGRNLVLVARNVGRLEQTAAELRERYLIEVEVLPADLGTDEGCAAVTARIEQESAPIETVINNAGIGLYRGFGNADLADEEQLLNVNVRAVLRLTRAAVVAMRPRGRGEIVNISSVAGFAPRGKAVTYAASKSWVTAFTEGVSMTLTGTGVRAGAICPGFTHTEIHDRAGTTMDHVPSWLWLTADRVVAEGLADVRAGKAVSIPSKRYKALVQLMRFTPRRLLLRIMRSN